MNATANVPGTFTYTPPAGTVLDESPNQELRADFTPADTTNYNPASATVHINVIPEVTAPVVTATSLPDGGYRISYPAQTLHATGGSGGYTWSIVSGSLPSGLSLDSLSGNVSGTPTKVGTFTFIVQVTDSGARTGTKVLSITINSKLTITTRSLPRASSSSLDLYSQTIECSGGTGPRTWSLSGELPEGLTFDAATATISGIPAQNGHFRFVVQVTDSLGDTDTKRFSLHVSGH